MKMKLFSMIEVTLAIAVVGIGIAGIMAMFPVAIQSSRDAVAQNYIADGVEQLSTVITTLSNGETNWTSGSLIGGMPTTLAGCSGNETACTTPYGSIYLPGVNFQSGTAMLKMASTNGNDFSAGIRFWKTPIQNIYLNQQNLNMPDTTYGAGIYMEVSWPAAKPYALREKRVYYYELFNSNI